MSKAPLGVLILHGFTDTVHSMRSLEPPLSELGLPYRIPCLRGHGAASPEALRGVCWQDWIVDAHDALEDLLIEVDKAIVIGYSMGGLIGIHIAAENPGRVDSLVLAEAVIQIKAPIAPGRLLSFLAPLVVRLVRKWPMPPVYVDPALAEGHDSYPWAPTEAIATLFALSREAGARLKDVVAPTLILQSRKDGTAAPACPGILYNGISTPAGQKSIHWFERTGHEMFRDCERHEVVAVITDFIRERISSEAARGADPNRPAAR